MTFKSSTKPSNEDKIFLASTLNWSAFLLIWPLRAKAVCTVNGYSRQNHIINFLRDKNVKIKLKVFPCLCFWLKWMKHSAAKKDQHSKANSIYWMKIGWGSLPLHFKWTARGIDILVSYVRQAFQIADQRLSQKSAHWNDLQASVFIADLNQ